MKEIRKATPSDAEAIEAIILENWNQKIDDAVFENQITQDTCALQVATEHDKIVGFVSAFLTPYMHNTLRWTIDLLAVHPNDHSKGYGTALIQSVWEIAKQQQADFSGGIVRTDNIASQKAFQKAGYTTDGQTYHLYLWPPKHLNQVPTTPSDILLLPMNTLTYRGLWIEGLTLQTYSEKEQWEIISKAQNIVAEQKRANTGALIPVNNQELLNKKIRDQGTIHGEYTWWIRAISHAK